MVSFNMKFYARWQLAAQWAMRHALISMIVAAISATVVFKLWYPMPFREMLGVGKIFLIILGVDVVCGPLMTLILVSPRKSRRETTLDLSLIAIIQTAALIYGVHAVWMGRPVVLAFEQDRLTIISANEVDASDVPNAPRGLRELPYFGILKVATRRPRSTTELLNSIEISLVGITPAMRPSWWEPIADHKTAMREKAKPLSNLILQRPADNAVLKRAAHDAGYPAEALVYLPLTSSKTKEWVALLNGSLEMVGYAPVDGFE